MSFIDLLLKKSKWKRKNDFVITTKSQKIELPKKDDSIEEFKIYVPGKGYVRNSYIKQSLAL